MTKASVLRSSLAAVLSLDLLVGCASSKGSSESNDAGEISTTPDENVERAGTAGTTSGGAGGAEEAGGTAARAGTTASDGGGAGRASGSSGGAGASGAANAAGGAEASGGAEGSGGAEASGGAGASGAAGASGGDAGASGGAGGSAGSRGEAGRGGGAGGDAGGSGTVVPGDIIRLRGRQILDVQGNPVVARGPEDVVASTEQTEDVDAAAAFGANAMRMLFTLDAANGMTPEGFDALLAAAVSHHMLVWVSLYSWDSDSDHLIADALGGGNFYALTAPSGTSDCSADTPSSCYLAVWSRPWLKTLMSKYRSNVIIDAAQEFISPVSAETEEGRATWADAAKENIVFFREQEYENPLEIMANFQGRDLYGIIEHGDEIRAADRRLVDGEPQTMFGWQAYWGTDDHWYQSYQGSLLLAQDGATITAADAMDQFVATSRFPIQVGIDNFSGDTNLDYADEIDRAAANDISWLWWSWRNGTVECPVSGATCQSYVTTGENGFAGARPLGG